jgi:hypothetical protein
MLSKETTKKTLTKKAPVHKVIKSTKT